ncbi:ParB family protein [Vibrio sp. D431a]|uniref:ParB family protein n=1 Tax=Vibrio sp. D431a TaxID=2837388 RepID=UPI0025531881|nr:ParB family protein [Vibrio sp. D431a]MDK9793858.1 ParB N-terminal domain-containing protein [Vibrio sp. D431a]
MFGGDAIEEDSSAEKKLIAQHDFETKQKPLFKQLLRTLESGAKNGVDTTGALTKFLSESGISIDESGTPFPLANDQEVIFDLLTIPSDQIEALTEVHPSNERDPNALTEESLQDIIPSLSDKGNLFPAIANKSPETDKIQLMDGSRRRKSCIISGKPLRIYVARTQITHAEARYISQISRRVKTHSYYELGLVRLEEFESLDEKGNRKFEEKKDYARYLFGETYTDSEYQTLLSQLKFAEIPLSLISIIPDYNGLAVNKYKSVYKVSNSLLELAAKEETNVDVVIKNFLGTISKEVSEINDETKLDTKKKQSKIISLLDRSVGSFIKAPPKFENIVTPLVTFTQAHKFVRKIQTKSTIQFEFKRIPDSKIKEVEEAIRKIISPED